MDMKDVAAITIARSFNRKWWESKRSSKAKGSGVGAALAEWERNCPSPPATLDGHGLDTADATCAKLRKALQNAIAKCGKDAAEAVAGARKMLTLIGPYEDALAVRRKAVVSAGMVISTALDGVASACKTHLAALPAQAAEVRDSRARIAEFARRAKGTLMQRDKQQLQEALKAEEAVLKDIDDRIGVMAIDIKDKANMAKPQVQQAQQDGRFRADLQRMQAATAAFDKAQSPIYQAAVEAKAQVAELLKGLVKADTADDALAAMSRHVATLQDAPNLQSFAGGLDDLKKWTPKVVLWGRDPAKLTRSDWAEVHRIEEDFRGVLTEVTARGSELERLHKEVAALGKSWAALPLMQQQLKAAERLIVQRQKERSDLAKFIPPFQKQINALLDKQP